MILEISLENIEEDTHYVNPVNSSVFHCEGESLTKQSFKDECDIYKILNRFGVQALASPASDSLYRDVSNVMNYQDALNTVLQVEDAFEELSSEEKLVFENDPSKFYDFCVEGKLALPAEEEQQKPDEPPVEKEPEPISD